ncbi:sigma-54-dependent Fis family transcriptional regulator [Natronospirillum operosum]|uniref:Sigma-54-dependent Fis family transcriptional regulator n=1 Tax=Natronospirillum operosum TaxID=2759953 RepID=A0A4Z0WJJ4_9GAMM|nr:sigma-54-dependent Fis family transcriptional regulator [Natronospirillum operosum]TGG95671.1 sigma-54-dependent Fis family transcriptional regulator [Natronospirillum operosum]
MTSSRISLAEIVREAGGQPFRGHSDHLNNQSSPTLDELSECLQFSPGDGRIWLTDQRMLLVHASSFGSMRRELIDMIGLEKTRGLLTRTGYVSGARDAHLVRTQWPSADHESIFFAGTKLHALEGAVQVETVRFEFDSEKGLYDGEFLWYHSSEDDEHLASYGVGVHPACWMELGYAMGYVSGLIGSMVIFREVECRSMGHSLCRVIGKSAEMWPDPEEDLKYINISTGEANVPRRSESAAPLVSLEPTNSRQMIGGSAAFTAANHALNKVAGTMATVLFIGESGVGKELFASRLHATSPISSGPFVAFNCAAIPDNLLEAELFGVEKGAFTGASASRPGRFERAHGGTLFLDEISELDLAGQSKLLRALQESEIERVGGTHPIKLDVRIVAATNIDLRQAVAEGRFREDLFYRLNVFPITIPPLRERRSDIPLLISHFFNLFCTQHDRHPNGITQRASMALLNYDFPGNIRELQNIIERGVIASEDNEPLDLPHLFRNEKIPDSMIYSLNRSGGLSTNNQSTGLSDNTLSAHLEAFQNGDAELSLDELEQQLIQNAVQSTRGNLSKAARRLGLTRPQLAYRMKKHGLSDSPP